MGVANYFYLKKFYWYLVIVYLDFKGRCCQYCSLLRSKGSTLYSSSVLRLHNTESGIYLFPVLSPKDMATVCKLPRRSIYLSMLNHFHGILKKSPKSQIVPILKLRYIQYIKYIFQVYHVPCCKMPEQHKEYLKV